MREGYQVKYIFCISIDTEFNTYIFGLICMVLLFEQTSFKFINFSQDQVFSRRHIQSAYKRQEIYLIEQENWL